MLLGSVTGSYGVKGWVKVYSRTDPPEAILDYSPWMLKQGATSMELKVVAHRFQGKKLLVQLEGVTDRNQAEALQGYEVFTARERLPALAEGEFYWFELQGLQVRNTQGALLGLVDRLLETGANDVLVVKPTAGSVDEAERLIPYVKEQVVKAVDLAAGVVTVDWDADY